MFKYLNLNIIILIIINVLPIKSQDMKVEGNMGKHAIAYFGGGCFWCTEAVFEMLDGVEDVVSGYSGGQVKNPAYREVTSGRTGHAEVVKIVFRPERITYKELLEVFFRSHDPTSLNRQGADIGTHYRSIILYTDDGQKEIAQNQISKLNLSGKYKDPLVTQLVPFSVFYEAEEYHQDYFRRNPEQAYCSFVISPKVNKVKTDFAGKIRK